MPQLDLTNFFRIIFFLSILLMLISVYFLYIIRHQQLRIKFIVQYYLVEILGKRRIILENYSILYFQFKQIFLKNKEYLEKKNFYKKDDISITYFPKNNFDTIKIENS